MSTISSIIRQYKFFILLLTANLLFLIAHAFFSINQTVEDLPRLKYAAQAKINGFRNPYRFSFDKASGQLFAGDVGQDLWEEIDIVKKGGNYGWRITEGTHCYNPAKDCDVKGITMPIAEYNHREGVSVTAGYVYNGKVCRLDWPCILPAKSGCGMAERKSYLAKYR